jgi:hypothetical protein
MSANSNSNVNHGTLLHGQSLKHEVPLRSVIVATDVRQVHLWTGGIGTISRRKLVLPDPYLSVSTAISESVWM